MIALLMWFLLKGPCQLAGLDTKCVSLGDQTFYNPGGLMAIGAGLGLLLAVGIEIFPHLSTSNG